VELQNARDLIEGNLKYEASQETVKGLAERMATSREARSEASATGRTLT